MSFILNLINDNRFLFCLGLLDLASAALLFTDIGSKMDEMITDFKTPASIEVQVSDICKKQWPDTLDGALARRRACGPIIASGGPD